MRGFLKNLYFANRLFWALSVVILLFLFGFPYHFLFPFAQALLFVTLLLLLVDIFMLHSFRKPLEGLRNLTDKLSNGDDNLITLIIENRTSLHLYGFIIDEIPHQFQRRDLKFPVEWKPRQVTKVDYTIRPTQRGEYEFGDIQAFIASKIGFAMRRITIPAARNAAVYPGYLQLRSYELMAISDRLSELGIKKMRRIGHNIEFEQIKEYVPGDDYRTLNWKATARKGTLMVNNYQDERSQQVYALLDKGRMMRSPFNGMTLLDYAINATLVISYIAISREDKAGLISFEHRMDTTLPASKRKAQMNLMMEVLYKQDTQFLESDYGSLYAHIRRKLNQRSLLLLFTNFESVVSLERQLPFLRKLSANHLLVCIFFENTELQTLLDKEAENLDEIYEKATAEKFAYEKHLIVKELRQYGIHTILTSPEKLTVNTINKYLELKSRGLI